MPESKVVNVVRAHRLAMSAHEAETMRDMAVRWLGVERAIDGNIAALANEMLRRTQAGEVITPSMIRAANRYEILKAQTEREILKYNKDAAAIISDGQVTALEQGLQTAQDAIVSSGFNASYNKINVGAVDAMVGYAGDGSPLVSLLNDSVSAGAADSIVQSLIDGIGQGLGADAVARDIAGDLGGNFDRSLVIARTEINRSYRSASTEQYRQSGVVDGFMRLVSRDEACLACIALDGEKFDSPDEMDDHPNGRCTCVPIIAGEAPPEWETAQEWLANQSDEKQLEIMGTARFEMFKAGTPISAFGEKRQSDIWGDSPKVVTIQDLQLAAHGNAMNVTGDALQGTELEAQNRDAILQYANENKIANSRIIFESKDALDEFGGTKLGDYNFDTRKVTIYPAGLNRPDAIETMVHEIAHMQADRPENFSNIKDSIFTKTWKKVTDMDDKPKYSTLKNAGNVSEYTTDVLKQFGKRNPDLVLNEAWAELSRLNHIGQLESASPFWQEYYAEMKKAVRR